MADWRMKGNYLKNCNCVPSCSCDTSGFPSPHDNCEGVVGMLIEEGHFDGVDLSGCKWAGTVYWPGALHEGNGTMEAFIDEGASEEQRVIVQMPGGFEYKEMEVAQTGTLKSTGDVKFDHSGTHSSLAEVDHTPAGLAA